jgi:hypothetical protein
LILFSSKSNRADLEVIAESIEKSCSSTGRREGIFDLIIGQEDLLYLQDIEFHVLDINILLSQNSGFNQTIGNQSNLKNS